VSFQTIVKSKLALGGVLKQAGVSAEEFLEALSK
jgi:hypothetical protein